MKTRKGKEVEQQPHNFVRTDYLEMRLLKIEERLARLEKMVESIIPNPNQPVQPRTIRPEIR